MDGPTDQPGVSDQRSRGAKQSELIGRTRSTPPRTVSQERLLDLISLDDARPARRQDRQSISAERRSWLQLRVMYDFVIAMGGGIVIAFTDFGKDSLQLWLFVVVFVAHGLLVLAMLKWRHPK